MSGRRHLMPDDSLRTARWLLSVVVFLIVYGSLYPFRFEDAGAGDIGDLLARLPWARTTRSDIAANVLLYLPFGACLAWMLAGRLGGLPALIVTTLLGTLLATLIEVAQIYETRRVASLADVVFNAAGTLAGGAIALSVLTAQRRPRHHPLAPALAQPIATALLLLWVGYRLAPFAIALDPAEWRASLAPLATDPRDWVSGAGIARYLIAWLIVGQAIITIRRGRGATRTLAICMMAVIAGMVLIAGKAIDPAELVAMLMALVLSWPLGRLQAPRATALLAVALATLLVLDGLMPFDFAVDPDAFGLVPFRDSLARYRSTNLLDMFLKCFLYGALVWLLVQARLRVAVATVLAGGLVLGIEFLQVWLPGKPADITDPLMVVAAGGLLAIFEGPPDAGRVGWR